jgi:PAS domain S-box-containing protein
MFGYARGEMDGKNVSILMPQPFSSKHDSFLSNYLSTGNAKILNTQRAVVALTKVRGVTLRHA